MPGIKELIRSEEDGTISFGNYELCLLYTSDQV